MAGQQLQPVSVPIYSQSTLQGNTQGSPVQYVVLNPGPQNTVSRPASKVEYAETNIDTVKWLAKAQLVLGAIIFVFHVITTALNEEFINRLNILKSSSNINSFFEWDMFTDHLATGVWFGILVVVSAVVGINGCERQKKGLIVAHLVLNVVILLCMFVQLGTVSSNISAINDCRRVGESYYNTNDNRPYHYDDIRYTTPWYPTTRPKATATKTTQKPPEFYGETLKGSYGHFYCAHAMFRAWLALDAMSLVCSLLLFVLTLTILVYNSIAACRCCRRTGYRGSCCCYGSADVVPLPVVSYYSQPSAAAASLNQPQMIVSPQLTSQPQYTSQLYAQRPMMYGQATMMPAGVPYGQQVMGVPSITTQMAAPAAVSQVPAGADAADEKCGDLPPEYAAADQNHSNQGGQ